MSVNPHAKQAIDSLNIVNKAMHPTEAMALASVQTQATLALAYEQRTANLMAFYATIPSKLGADTQMLRSQILKRLGLA